MTPGIWNSANSYEDGRVLLQGERSRGDHSQLLVGKRFLTSSRVNEKSSCLLPSVGRPVSHRTPSIKKRPRMGQSWVWNEGNRGCYVTSQLPSSKTLSAGGGAVDECIVFVGIIGPPLRRVMVGPILGGPPRLVSLFDGAKRQRI